MKHQWIDLFLEELVTVSSVFTTVHEDVELARVSMKVTIHSDGALLHYLLDHDLSLVNRRKGFLDHILVLPVEIAASKVTASVANDDTVRIQHRDNLEDEPVSERSGSVCVPSQVLDDSSHHPRAGSLSRMNPGDSAMKQP